MATTVQAVAVKRPHAVPHLSGEDYLGVLRRLHTLLAPRSYLEIGTRTGDSLACATCASVGVDPALAIDRNVVGRKPACHLMQMTSDRFFADHDPAALLGGPVEFAFLDGMHLFEFLLRDFANTERCCRPNSVIALHDCIPTDAYVTERHNDAERRRSLGSIPEWWTGDVWKLLPILRRWRPDLVVHTVDAAPTGLVLITNLDPESDVLGRNYFAIVEAFADVELIDYGIERFIGELRLIPTSRLRELRDVASLFWL